MDPVTVVLLVAALGVAFLLVRRRTAPRRPSLDALAGDLTPKPLAEALQVDGWDGFSGMQMALAVGLSDGRAFPLIPAGSDLPAQKTQTFSTAAADRGNVTVALYAGLSSELGRMQLVQRVSVGPVPRTGPGLREVDVTFFVNEAGRVSVAARRPDDGAEIPCRVTEEGLGAIPYGRRPGG